MLSSLSLKDYPGGARVKNLHSIICGVNIGFSILIKVINLTTKRTLQISIVETSELLSTVSKIKESS
jgi:hypothetical protein